MYFHKFNELVLVIFGCTSSLQTSPLRSTLEDQLVLWTLGWCSHHYSSSSTSMTADPHRPTVTWLRMLEDTVLCLCYWEWCDSSCLELNVSKAKEMVVTFSNRQRELAAAAATTTIHGDPVELVEEYKYLGTIFDCQLKFSIDTEEIIRRCQHWQYPPTPPPPPTTLRHTLKSHTPHCPSTDNH